MVTLENSPLVKHQPLAATDIRVQVVIDFVNSNPGKHLTLSELARRVNLSDSRFRHLFVCETGMSPRAYLRQLRLAHAKSLLAENRLSIDEIALKVGWQERSHFEREFKRIYGITPAQSRKMQLISLLTSEITPLVKAAIS
jgi:transcriptional regulator GlxA family with amidase domain